MTPNTAKSLLALVILAAAAGVWYWSGRTERAARREAVEAVRDITFRLKCSACNQVFEMPGSEYAAQVDADGIKCIHCGQKKAWRIGTGDDVDPAQFKDECDKLTSVDQVRSATDELQKELADVEAALINPDVTADKTKASELRKRRGWLQAKRQALDKRWDELAG